jgi:hypothetical protein
VAFAVAVIQATVVEGEAIQTNTREEVLADIQEQVALV